MSVVLIYERFVPEFHWEEVMIKNYVVDGRVGISKSKIFKKGGAFILPNLQSLMRDKIAP